MERLTRLSYTVIRKSFDFSVWLIARFTSNEKLLQKERGLAAMPEGSLGKEISKCLTANNVRLIKGFESHDLKHVLLGYKMTPLDEIRMQAFMLGNGNVTLPCVAILLFGIALLPSKWRVFRRDFKKGRQAEPVSGFTIKGYAHEDIVALRQNVLNAKAVNQKQPLLMAKLLTYTVLFSGIAGMVFCLPFLFSSSVGDLVGAGFPFVGGAILVAGGLVSLSNLSAVRHQNI